MKKQELLYSEKPKFKIKGILEGGGRKTMIVYAKDQEDAVSVAYYYHNIAFEELIEVTMV